MPGKSYPYELRVEIVRDGKPVTDVRKVIVKSGEVIRASFKDLAELSTVQSSTK